MLTFETVESLIATAEAMVAPHKGILAADESNATITKRFEGIKTESTEESRRRYREILFTTKGMEDYISGVILYDETLRQKTSDGVLIPKYLAEKGVIPGIKVDTGAKPLSGSEGEFVTEGLDGLRERLAEYHKLGARFAKWRAVITITDEFPTDYCINTNAHALARYAALCQEAGIVPIVEPEVMMDGGNMDHDMDRCEEVTTIVLKKVFDELFDQGVILEGMILKPSMVVPGKNAKKVTATEVADATLRTYYRTVPAAVQGLVFLSGGQSDEDATLHLNEMNVLGPHPWQLSFSYGRALQASALKAWGGKEVNVEVAQKAFLQRAKENSQARDGKYNASGK